MSRQSGSVKEEEEGECELSGQYFEDCGNRKRAKRDSSWFYPYQ